MYLEPQDLDEQSFYKCKDCGFVALGEIFIDLDGCRCGGERFTAHDPDHDDDQRFDEYLRHTDHLRDDDSNENDDDDDDLFDNEEVYREANQQFQRERGIYPKW